MRASRLTALLVAIGADLWIGSLLSRGLSTPAASVLVPPPPGRFVIDLSEYRAGSYRWIDPYRLFAVARDDAAYVLDTRTKTAKLLLNIDRTNAARAGFHFRISSDRQWVAFRRPGEHVLASLDGRTLRRWPAKEDRLSRPPEHVGSVRAYPARDGTVSAYSYVAPSGGLYVVEAPR